MTDTDVLIVRQGNTGTKATLNTQSDKAKKWVRKNMIGSAPLQIDYEAVDPLQKAMEHDGLKVEVR